MKKLYLYLICLLTSLYSNAKNYHQEDFINLLNIEKGYKTTPNGYFFSDLGSWHGYGFNNPTEKTIYGLRGPVFMGERNLSLQWLSDCFEQLIIEDLTNGKNPIRVHMEHPIQEYLPGMLRLSNQNKEIKMQIRELAISDRTSMMEYKITNLSQQRKKLQCFLTGTATYSDAQCHTVNEQTLSVNVNEGKHSFVVLFPEKSQLILESSKSYKTSLPTIELRKGASYTFYTYTTYTPGENVQSALEKQEDISVEKPELYLKANRKRWNGYLNAVLKRLDSNLNTPKNRDWLIKSLMTLNTNWRSAAGDLKHAGVQPAAGHFDGFWAWDSWIHAAALAIFNPELAKDQMRTMFDYQTPEGMVIDLIAFDKKGNNPICSKPPIAGWATYLVYQQTKDKAFIEEMLPKLIKYHEWRYQYRDHDQNGLCEYGGISSEVYMGQWESGMDVAVKFHGVKMLKNAEKAYSFDQESVELNCYLCAEKFYLAYLLEEIGRNEEAEHYKTEGTILKKKIQDCFYDQQTGYFYDRKLGSGELVKVIDISGWIPLFTNMALPEQAKTVKQNMLDPNLFGTYFPFSSLNHKHPLYQPDNGYFRGQIWMNYTYFGIRGWKNYGFNEEAHKYTLLLPEKLKGLTEKGEPVRENWNAETGEGLCAVHFSWSSAFSILLLTDESNRFPYVPETES